MDDHNLSNNGQPEKAVKLEDYQHMVFLGKMLCKGIEEFEFDIISQYPHADEVIKRRSFLEMVRLREKWLHAITLGGENF